MSQLKKENDARLSLELCPIGGSSFGQTFTEEFYLQMDLRQNHNLQFDALMVIHLCSERLVFSEERRHTDCKSICI